MHTRTHACIHTHAGAEREAIKAAAQRSFDRVMHQAAAAGKSMGARDCTHMHTRAGMPICAYLMASRWELDCAHMHMCTHACLYMCIPYGIYTHPCTHAHMHTCTLAPMHTSLRDPTYLYVCAVYIPRIYIRGDIYMCAQASG